MLHQNSITVIITTYNSSGYIEKSIKSVLNQSIKVSHILIIDDNSSDLFTLKKIITEINKKNFIEIKLISNEYNRGPGFSRNYAWSKCITEFIAFLDDDDFWYKDKLKQQMDIFKNDSTIKLVASKKKMTNQNISTYRNNNLLRITYSKLLFKNFIATSSVVLKTNLKERFLDKYYAEDYYLWLSIVKKGYSCYFINNYLCEESDIKKSLKLSSNFININKGVQSVLNLFYSKSLQNNILIFSAKFYYYIKFLFKLLFRRYS